MPDQRRENQVPVTLALFAAMAGGVVVAADGVASVSIPVAVAGGALLIGGLAALMAVAFADSRTTGARFWRSLGRAVRTGFHLMIDLL